MTVFGAYVLCVCVCVCVCVYVCLCGERLWLTPSAGGQPETLSCYDFEPTGTNDLRSLVAKVNRKLSRNQFKGQNPIKRQANEAASRSPENNSLFLLPR